VPATLAADEAASDQNSLRLEEIIVTARRREENLQKVPISITELSPQQIRDNNITTLLDVQQLVPSLTVTTGNVGQRDSANVSIRGQGWGSFGQPATAMYLNEVPIPTDYSNNLAGGPGLFFDLENVQVLKGPQGTLFGKNTMGGAILLQSARPTNDFGGRISVGYGN
jgi:iron complex outermembrane receptor protein